jgi:hypothetical protein
MPPEKRCAHCGLVKPRSEFWRDRAKRDGLDCSCRSCRKAARGHEHGTYTPEFKQALIDLLGGACALCGFNRYRTALQFHHVNPAEKDILVSKLLKRYREICPEVEAELDKCCLLCANCHHAVHAREIEVSYSRRECIGWNAQLASNS